MFLKHQYFEMTWYLGDILYSYIDWITHFRPRFDTIARLETQAIDAYNDAHHYRAENPLSHLHEDEAPVETDKLKSFH